jgi:GT2 family glycosyltransferase
MTAARCGFGHDVLGPIFGRYMHRLHRSMEGFARLHGARPLFAARAGLRLRHLYEIWCAARGAEPAADRETLWISRFLAGKGLWSVRRDASLALLLSEFGNQDVRAVVQAVFHVTGGMPASIPADDPSLSLPSQRLPEVLSAKGLVADALEDHLAQQSALFLRYLDVLLEGRSAALLIDSGWQGTIQRLLQSAFPGRQWYGAYIGRSFFPNSDRSIAHRMFGLVFEADAFDVSRPETAIILHRHLIEAVLEPHGPSIELLAGDPAGEVHAPQAQAFAELAPAGEADAIYAGIAAYLAGPAGAQGVSAAERAFARASAEFARRVIFPTREDAELLGGGDRSADFGRSLRVPVLLPAAPRREGDTAERRIADSLWPAGQIAREYPAELSLHRQQQQAGLKLSPTTLESRTRMRTQPEPAPERGTRPRVAVIMRTMDRPLFLRRALASVARQRFRDWCLVVVCDGGDAEGAAAAIAGSILDQRRVILVDAVRNRGMEAASNLGILASDSDYVVIHDDDDTWEPGFLRTTVDFMDMAPEWKYGGVITHSTYVSEEVTPAGVVTRRRVPYHDWVQNVQLAEMVCENFFPPIAFLFRRSLCQKLGGFDERFPVLGDWDFNLRTLAVTDIGVIPTALANYHHRDTGNVGLYANSVIGMRSKHAEYNPLLRHKYLRQDGTAAGGRLAQMLPMAALAADLRRSARASEELLRTLQEQNRERLDRADYHARNADDRWVLLLAERARTADLEARLQAQRVAMDAAEQRLSGLSIALDAKRHEADELREQGRFLLDENRRLSRQLDENLGQGRAEMDARLQAMQAEILRHRCEAESATARADLLQEVVQSLQDDLWVLQAAIR